jgi:nuclear cap-binding protein subunit 1
LSALVRRKAPDLEIAAIIESIEQAAAASGIPNPKLVSTDAFVTSICFIGSKSLSHVLSCIERCKERLLAIGPSSPTAQRQIITSVMEYWKHQPGVGLNIIDKLLNYTILTPMSVIEWALVDHVQRGTVLSEAWIYEMISSTVGKVTNRVRQIVAALRRPGLPEEQVGLLKETLEREMRDMKALFGSIDDALLSFRDGYQDQMMEADSQSQNESTLVRSWGARWMRVFQRKYAVEENWVKEELAKPLPEPEPEPAQDFKMEVKEQPAVNGQNGTGHETNDEAIE